MTLCVLRQHHNLYRLRIIRGNGPLPNTTKKRKKDPKKTTSTNGAGTRSHANYFLGLYGV